jgi:drug/metabolite transporter (DMT)-like permease
LAYTSILTGLATAFCWGTADFLSRYQSQKVGYYKTVVYSNVVTLIVLVALVPLVSPNLEVATFPLVVLLSAGALNFIAFNFLYRAFHKGVVSVVAPIAYTFPAVTTVLSVLILGTFVPATRVVAIGGIIVGVILLSTRFSELGSYRGGRGAPNLTAGVGSAIGSSLFFGSVYIGIGYAAPFVSVVIPAIVLRSVAIVAGFLLAPVLHQAVRPSRVSFSRIILVMGVLEAVGFLSFTYGISGAQGALPVVASLAGMGGAVAAAYGFIFLRERLELNQIVGVFLSIIGVFTLLYLGG